MHTGSENSYLLVRDANNYVVLLQTGFNNDPQINFKIFVVKKLTKKNQVMFIQPNFITGSE